MSGLPHSRGRDPAGHRRGPLLAVVLAVATAVLVTAGPASGHDTDPRLVAVLDRITPALPRGVVIQVVANVTAQVAVANPTRPWLTAIGADGDAFVRVSNRGVQANLASPDWYVVNDPGGGIPPEGVRAGAPAKWATVGRADSFGWFDPRVSPLTAPPAIARGARDRVTVASWSTPLRYGARTVTAQGHIEFRPVLGAYLVTADRPPAGLQVAVLQGRLPGLFVTDTSRGPVAIAGGDGRDFLRLGSFGVRVDRDSPSWRADRQARGLPVTGHGWLTLSRQPAVSWLDPRLLPPADPPARFGQLRIIRRWHIPVRIGGRLAALSGGIEWRPGAATPASTSAGRHFDPGGDFPLAAVVASALGAAVVLGGTILVKRRKSAQG